MIIKNTWQGYWSRHHTHEYGMCFPDHQNKKFWVNIPKNATNWGKAWASQNQLRRNNYHQEKYLEQDYQPIIFLRDPIDRWYSGIAEFLTRYSVFDITKPLSNDVLSLMLERVAFDEHTEEQALFLEGIDTNRAVWFCVDDNLINNFKHFTQSVLKQDVELVPKVMKYTSQGKKLKLRNHLKEAVSELLYQSGGVKIPALQRLNDYYALDYQLYNSVKYYRKGEK